MLAFEKKLRCFRNIALSIFRDFRCGIILGVGSDVGNKWEGIQSKLYVLENPRSGGPSSQKLEPECIRRSSRFQSWSPVRESDLRVRISCTPSVMKMMLVLLTSGRQREMDLLSRLICIQWMLVTSLHFAPVSRSGMRGAQVKPDAHDSSSFTNCVAAEGTGFFLVIYKN